MKINKINYIEPIADIGGVCGKYKFRYKRRITLPMYLGKITANITHLKECLYDLELITNDVSDRTACNMQITTDECLHPLWVLRELSLIEPGLFLTMLKYKEVGDNVYNTH